MKKSLCLVIQRYGEEIVGGAETYCRIYAERLSKIYDITVITTCALDYITWNNYFPEGETVINNVRVIRFKTDVSRNINDFSSLTLKLMQNPYHRLEDAREWLIKQGPLSHSLIDYIKDNKDHFSLFVFMTYLYYPTVEGLPLVKEKSVLIPFAHDEPPIYFKVFDEIFNMPAGIVFNTDEEKNFIHEKFNNDNIPYILTGIGIDKAEIKEYNIENILHDKFDYIIYIGRIDISKGCEDLFSDFLKYKKMHNNNLKLVLIGKEILKIPKSKDIISLGFVSEEVKTALLQNCIALILPSYFESLSIAVLEAFALKKPVLVNGHCEVLKGHCIKSNGGLYYYSDVDFELCLDLLYSNKQLAETLGNNGNIYVLKNYEWNIIIKILTDFLDEI